ncbi:GxxExxY protein [Patescibacteria group bacterium]|nr:GxxExxY protein [Patescibacteria group bacterium]
MANKIIEQELCYKLNGLFFEVQNRLGRYLTEKQYADGLEFLFKEHQILYEREKEILIPFGEGKIGGNKVDFIIEGKIIIDIKAKKYITKEDYLQMRRYLEAANLQVGLLVNFKSQSVTIKRVLSRVANPHN